MFKCLSCDFPDATSYGMGMLTWGWGKGKSLELKGNVADVSIASIGTTEVEFTCRMADGRTLVAKSDLATFEKINNLADNPQHNLGVINEQKQALTMAKKEKQAAANAAMMAEVRAREAQKASDKQAEKDRLAQYDKEGIPYCPKCHSISLSANKKGFGGGKALVGAVVAGPLGLLAGTIGKNNIEVTCLKCGHKFKV